MVNLPIEYSSKQVPPFGGMSLLKRFIDRLGVREKFQELSLPEKGSNRSYSASHIIESFWLSIWTGASRYVHAEWLRYDTTMQSIFCWDKIPSQSTYSRFFSKFSRKKNSEIFPELQKWFVERVKIENITLDIDSTVITRYGNQEGSTKGYNPQKRGRATHIIH